MEESLPKSLCLEALLTVALWGGTGLCLKCTLSPAAGSDVVPDLIQWYGGTSPARIVLYQAFKPVALPEQSLLSYATRRLPWGGTRVRCAGAPILNIYGQVGGVRAGLAQGRQPSPEQRQGRAADLPFPQKTKLPKRSAFFQKSVGSLPPQISHAPYDPSGPAVLAAPDLPAPKVWKAGRSQHCLPGSGAKSAQLLHPPGFVLCSSRICSRTTSGDPPRDSPGDPLVYSSDVPVAFQ